MALTELSLLVPDAPAVGTGPATMVGNVPINLMYSSVPEVHAGPTFVCVSMPLPTVAVALVIVAAYLATAARAMATATANSLSVSEPCPDVELEDAPLTLPVHPLIEIVAARQAAIFDAAGTTLRRDGTCESFHETHEPAPLPSALSWPR